MGRWTLSALVVAVVLAGCQGSEAGSSGEGSQAQGPPPPAAQGEVEPTFTAPPNPPTEGELDGPPECPRKGEDGGDAEGDVAVVDLSGEAQVQPRALEVSKDVSLECLEWSDWGKDEARAQGVARTLLCEPTCATGRVIYRPAELTVTDLGACGQRRAYRAGALTVGRDEAAQELDVFLDNPC
jgi:hypothetical protein